MYKSCIIHKINVIFHLQINISSEIVVYRKHRRRKKTDSLSLFYIYIDFNLQEPILTSRSKWNKH